MGLRELLKLGPRRTVQPTDAADDFRTEFQKRLQSINGSLQYTAAFATRKWNEEQVVKRDKLIAVYQATLAKFRGGNVADARVAAEKVLNVAEALKTDIGRFKANTQASAEEWQDTESTFDAALALTDQLEEAGDEKSVSMRAILSKIQSHANQKEHGKATDATKKLADMMGIKKPRVDKGHDKEHRDAPKTASAKTAPRLGLQTLFLGDFSQDSTDRLAKLLCHPQAPTITLSVNPTFGEAANPYQNIETVVSRVHAAGKQIRLTVFLGFHDMGVSKALDKHAKELATFLQTPVSTETDAPNFFAAIAEISISPSLEDNYNDETAPPEGDPSNFEKGVQKIAKHLPAEMLRDAKLTFRRSVAEAESSDSLKKHGKKVEFDKTTKVDGVKAKEHFSKKVTHEYHHIAGDAKGYQVYANDGPLVYDPSYETENSLDEVPSKTKNPDAKTIQEYIDDVVNGDLPASVKEVLLWRPNYNLQNFENGEYNSSGDGEGRDDTDNMAFNQKEYDLAKKFLGIKDTPGTSNAKGGRATNDHQHRSEKKHDS